MGLPEFSYKTTNISEATALLCTDCAVVEHGYDDSGRFDGVCGVLLLTETIGDSDRCEFTIGYSDQGSFESRCEAFAKNTLMVPPAHYDRKKKLIVDAMREARRCR